MALPLQLQDHAVFESFLPAGNEPLVAFLQDLARAGEGPGCWVHGPASTGKTHLLQAFCERCGDSAQFVPLAELADAGPGLLEGLATRRFICVDDVDRIAGDRDWELGLFTLFNSLTESDGVLLCAASASARQCSFALPDLRSRFSTLPSFQLQPLAETDRMAALKLRARHRGLQLPEETAAYLLNHSRRDMASLYLALDRLDAAALEAQRRLTIPFVREVLGLSPRT